MSEETGPRKAPVVEPPLEKAPMNQPEDQPVNHLSVLKTTGIELVLNSTGDPAQTRLNDRRVRFNVAPIYFRKIFR